MLSTARCGVVNCASLSPTPFHRIGSPHIVVVAQEVDGLVVLPGDGIQISPATVFVSTTLGQLLAKPFEVVLEAWHDRALCQNSQFILQQVKEGDRVVK